MQKSLISEEFTILIEMIKDRNAIIFLVQYLETMQHHVWFILELYINVQNNQLQTFFQTIKEFYLKFFLTSSLCGSRERESTSHGALRSDRFFRETAHLRMDII